MTARSVFLLLLEALRLTSSRWSMLKINNTHVRILTASILDTEYLYEKRRGEQIVGMQVPLKGGDVENSVGGDDRSLHVLLHKNQRTPILLASF